MLKLSELFKLAFDQNAAEPSILDEVDIGSSCGADCELTIKAGGRLLRHVRVAVGDKYDDDIASLVEHTCVVYIRG